MTQRARTVAVKPDFRRDDGYGGRLTLGANHLHTSGGPKRAGTPKKRIEGVIQHSGITGAISTVSIQKMHESNIGVCYVKMTYEDMNEDLEPIAAGK